MPTACIPIFYAQEPVLISNFDIIYNNHGWEHTIAFPLLLVVLIVMMSSTVAFAKKEGSRECRFLLIKNSMAKGIGIIMA